VSRTPAPDATQLLVLVAPAVAGQQRDPDTVIAKLAAVAGRLRSEVAMAITRRRAPQLLFQFVAGQSAEEGETRHTTSSAQVRSWLIRHCRRMWPNPSSGCAVRMTFGT